jgi:hypothetical protein
MSKRHLTHSLLRRLERLGYHVTLQHALHRTPFS